MAAAVSFDLALLFSVVLIGDTQCRHNEQYFDSQTVTVVLSSSVANWHIFMPNFLNLAYFGGGWHKYFWIGIFVKFGVFWHIFQQPIF